MVEELGRRRRRLDMPNMNTLQVSLIGYRLVDVRNRKIAKIKVYTKNLAS